LARFLGLVMTARKYDTESVSEAAAILAREWSRHSVSVQARGAAFRLKFSIRPLSTDMSVNSLSYGAPVRIDPGARDAVLLFKMPVSGSERACFPRHDLLLDARNVSFVECDATFNSTVLRIKAARLKSYIESYLDRPVHQEPEFYGAMVNGSQEWGVWRPFWSLLNQFVCGGADIPPLVLAPLEEAVLASLLLTQANSYSKLIARPKPAAAPRHVKAAEEYVYENAHRSITTTTLAKHADVSVRALFDGFRQFRGMTPAQFVRYVRLERARRDLIAHNGNVLEIAERWGFGHPGNFAAHYARQFGEKPAETLRNSYPTRRTRH
jgi:AraC-like DNA-binding protein